MTSYRTNLKPREGDREGETFKRAAAGGGEERSSVILIINILYCPRLVFKAIKLREVYEVFGSLILPIKPGGVSWPAGSCRRNIGVNHAADTSHSPRQHAVRRQACGHVDMLTCLTVCGEWRV